MTVAEIDIETIVREVIRRLRDATSGTNDNNETIAGTQRVATSLELTDRVVTLAALNGKLTGIQNIIVPVRAVVTPAARDELKQRKITIERAAQAKPSGVAKPVATSGFTVAVATSGVCEVELKKLLGTAVTVVKQPASDAASVKSLSEGVVAGGRGVLVTSTPAAAAMLANRVNGVRAAYGFNFPAIRRAKDEIDANLLVIEPAGKSAMELAGMIVEFERK